MPCKCMHWRAKVCSRRFPTSAVVLILVVKIEIRLYLIASGRFFVQTKVSIVDAWNAGGLTVQVGLWVSGVVNTYSCCRTCHKKREPRTRS